MINRISEIPFWGPEEQIRRFIYQHDTPDASGNLTLNGETVSQQTITQQRIENLDDIFQKQLIWSYGRLAVDDAYFYQDWCPLGTGEITDLASTDPKWQMEQWGESIENKTRSIDRTFSWRKFQGYTNSRTRDEMVKPHESDKDVHIEERDGTEDPVTLDINTLRHNIMRSYFEVSEWLGDGAMQYGSHNGYVSRKMSLAWLFNAIKALINWKLENQDKWAEKNIYPLDVSEEHNERFLKDGEQSDCGVACGGSDGNYTDDMDLDQKNGRCDVQVKQRAKDPQNHGTLKVRGNEWHYGERADFYTHTSFIGECRFFHNSRFLGQATFDKEINGTAMRARWADLAEFKESDKAYEPGTLVMFGGEKEITLSRKGVCNAIVTTKPGFMLNADEPSKNCIMVGIALTGTVPVKIVGKVKKFDRLVASSTYPGYARAKRWYDFFKKPIAIALENSEPFGDFVNCMTKMEF